LLIKVNNPEAVQALRQFCQTGENTKLVTLAPRWGNHHLYAINVPATVTTPNHAADFRNRVQEQLLPPLQLSQNWYFKSNLLGSTADGQVCKDTQVFTVYHGTSADVADTIIRGSDVLNISTQGWAGTSVTLSRWLFLLLFCL
jgi:hypothetical protein